VVTDEVEAKAKEAVMVRCGAEPPFSDRLAIAVEVTSSEAGEPVHVVTEPFAAR
jgi:hypothetical protein